jgi:hypothetical protein
MALIFCQRLHEELHEYFAPVNFRNRCSRHAAAITVETCAFLTSPAQASPSSQALFTPSSAACIARYARRHLRSQSALMDTTNRRSTSRADN